MGERAHTKPSPLLHKRRKEGEKRDQRRVRVSLRDEDEDGRAQKEAKATREGGEMADNVQQEADTTRRRANMRTPGSRDGKRSGVWVEGQYKGKAHVSA